jgi:hypothetical protein
VKKLWVLVITAVLALGACGGDDDSDGNDDNPVLETPTTVTP